MNGGKIYDRLSKLDLHKVTVIEKGYLEKLYKIVEEFTHYIFKLGIVILEFLF